MNHETLEAYAAGLITKGWTPTRDDLIEFAQADVDSPSDAFEIGQLDAILKGARWVLESNLAKLGYVRIPGESKAKSGKGGNLVLARKGSELRDKAEKLGLNKKAGNSAHTKEKPKEMSERHVRDELKLVQSKISFITRTMPVGQITPTDPEWNSLHKRQSELYKMLADHTRDADAAKVAAEELRRKEYNDANENRKMALPTKQTRNGWDIATDGARWFLRDPATKEIIYDGTLKRVREVADESPPDIRSGGKAEPEKPAAQLPENAKGPERSHPYYVEDLSDEQKSALGADALSYMPSRGDGKKIWQRTAAYHAENYNANKMSDGREMPDSDIEWAKNKAKSDIKNRNAYGDYSIVRAQHGGANKYDVVKRGQRTLGTSLSLEKARKFALDEIERDLEPRETAKERVSIAYKQHRKNVEYAMQMGLPVPPEVLADYPDLAASKKAN